ncbi:STM4504/CBY_0614 family protein [Larkinella sp. VNQ87]|uniref:STM4504/CBY_0614 family protein n=1 Tax=Larkinella sp. VNQ87 TaxID=3400921 RepID=UPI003C0F88C3
MPIFDLYSRRQKRLNSEPFEVYIYNEIPKNLRVQIIHILTDLIGNGRFVNDLSDIYELIHNTLCREYGLFYLGDPHENYLTRLIEFITDTKEIEEILDVIEVSFHYTLEAYDYDSNFMYHVNAKIELPNAIEELNLRFKENGIGYSYEKGQILRIDSKYIHSEVTKPLLSLLSNKKFEGANEEYLNAHEHYRNGKNKECLNDCLKAFESTLKVICTEKGWKYDQTDTARKLIQICFQNNLVPTFTQNQFSSLQNLLESGIPTIRNKLGGHGQGQVPQKVDDEMTRYGLNLTGTNIIFLIEQSGIK